MAVAGIMTHLNANFVNTNLQGFPGSVQWAGRKFHRYRSQENTPLLPDPRRDGLPGASF